MKRKKLPPIHPGEILNDEFLKPMHLSHDHVAKCIGVPLRRVNEIVQGKRAITADTALRLGRFFGMSAQFWMNLQNRFDLETEGDRLEAALRDVQVYVPRSA